MKKWSNLFILVGMVQFLAVGVLTVIFVPSHMINTGSEPVLSTLMAYTDASPQLLNGTYSFVGNGLVFHNAENNPFWISYSVSYKEMKK